MALSYVGKISLAVLNPMSVSVAAALTASLGLQLTAFAELTAGIGISPPSIAGSLAATITIAEQLALAVTATLPSVDFQIVAVAEIIATLTAELGIPLVFQGLLEGEAGIFSYAYNDIGSNFGPDVTNALSASWPDGTPSTGSSNALIIATTLSSAWTDVLTLFNAVPPMLPVGFTYLAQQNIGGIMPILIDASFGTINSLNAQLNGCLALSASLAISPPSFTTSLSLLAELKASLQASLSVTLPGISFQLAAIAGAVAKINATISLLATVSASLAGGSVMIFSYSGTGAGLGPAITSALAASWPDGSPLTANANALVLGTTTSAVWTTMTTFFAGI